MNLDNVMQFPGHPGERDQASTPFQSEEHAEQMEPATCAETAPAVSWLRHRAVLTLGRFCMATLAVLLKTVRYVAFFVLRWIRGPVTLLLGAVSGIAILSSIVIFIGFSKSPDERWALLAPIMLVGFTASVLRFSYNWLLTILSPNPLVEL